jgi:hypothetical protein
MCTSSSTARRRTRWRWPRCAAATTASSPRMRRMWRRMNAVRRSFSATARRSCSPAARWGNSILRMSNASTSRNDLHFPKPRALSISQSTELGTVYRPGRDRRARCARQAAWTGHSHGRRAFFQRARRFELPPRLTSPGVRASMSCAAAARSSAWRSRRPWCSSTRSCRRIFNIAASRPGSFARRCASSPRSGCAC